MDLRPSASNVPGSQDIRIKLSCYYFPGFVIKQYDSGQKGAEWLAIVPKTGGSQPVCAAAHGPGEKVIAAPEWSGYFRGVKENLVFFNADNGYGGGLPFSVFDSKTGQKVIADSAYESSMWNQKMNNDPFNHMRVARTEDGSFRLLR